MNNADMPAMPNTLDVQTAGAMDEFKEGIGVAQLGYWQCGLGKREYFAGLVMQGFAADPAMADDSAEEVSDLAVIWADALLARLAK